MNYDNSNQKSGKLSATEQFVIHSMTKKIEDDWDDFCKDAQTKLEKEYNRIGSQSRVHSDTGFLQQQIDSIDEIKRSVEEQRRLRNIRKDDLSTVQEMLERNNK